MNRYILATFTVLTALIAASSSAFALQPRFEEAYNDNINSLTPTFEEAREGVINRLSDRFDEAHQENLRY